ncbi:MAG: hydrogenase formation protein HypD [Nitrospirales bacterium]
MKYVDEFRSPQAVDIFARRIRDLTHQPWTIMEVCGGQTHSIVRYGLDRLLPSALTLIHGPGCPVCVTPVELIDAACRLARLPNVSLCSFGDMLRVPGSQEDLLTVKAQGGDIRIIYSPLDALTIARNHPDRQIVLFAVGFETTAPAQAMALLQACRMGLTNLSMIVAHVLVPPAMEAILSSPHNRVQGFLAAGHVCTIMGYQEYEPICERYQVPIVVTGFEPLDIMEGVYLVVKQLEEGRWAVENQYTRSVRRDGNPGARTMIAEVFEPIDRNWRGIGNISFSGLQIKEAFREYDALEKFRRYLTQEDREPGATSECQSGQILQGLIKPIDCPAFGTRCTPGKPLGAPMVSSEGTCAAYYRYRHQETDNR